MEICIFEWIYFVSEQNSLRIYQNNLTVEAFIWDFDEKCVHWTIKSVWIPYKMVSLLLIYGNRYIWMNLNEKWVHWTITCIWKPYKMVVITPKLNKKGVFVH